MDNAECALAFWANRSAALVLIPDVQIAVASGCFFATLVYHLATAVNGVAACRSVDKTILLWSRSSQNGVG